MNFPSYIPRSEDVERTEQNTPHILTCTQNFLHQVCTKLIIHRLVPPFPFDRICFVVLVMRKGGESS